MRDLSALSAPPLITVDAPPPGPAALIIDYDTVQPYSQDLPFFSPEIAEENDSTDCMSIRSHADSVYFDAETGSIIAEDEPDDYGSTRKHPIASVKGPPTSSWGNALDHYASHFEYTLEGWCEKIRDSKSLRSAEIVKVDRYRQAGMVHHRFLVLQLRRENKSRDLFLRLDRRPEQGFSIWKFIRTSGATPSNDCAYLTADEKRAIRANTPRKVAMRVKLETSLTFPDTKKVPTLLDLERLLHAISRNMKRYRLTKENCWFFCAVCLEGLSRPFQGQWAVGTWNHVGLPEAPELRAAIYAQIVPPKAIWVGDTVSTVAIHPIENQIVSRSSRNTLQRWDATTGKAIGGPLSGHTSWVLSVALSPDGQRIASGANDDTIRLWDSMTGAPIGGPFEGHTEAISSISFSPNGRYIASGSRDNTIRLWDVATGAMIGGPFIGHTRHVNSVSFSPNGSRIVSASSDNTIRLWDTESGTLSGKSLKGHTGPVLSATFSPEGRYIVSCSGDKTIRLWDATTGRPIRKPLKGHSDWVSVAIFSPDGRHIVSGSYDNTIRLWNATTGDAIGGPFREHTDRINSLAFFPDGRRVATGSNDGYVRVWIMPV